MACFAEDRLRFDLAIFAVALAHRRLFITNNTTEFQLFAFPEQWATVGALEANLGLGAGKR